MIPGAAPVVLGGENSLSQGIKSFEVGFGLLCLIYLKQGCSGSLIVVRNTRFLGRLRVDLRGSSGLVHFQLLALHTQWHNPQVSTLHFLVLCLILASTDLSEYHPKQRQFFQYHQISFPHLAHSFYPSKISFWWWKHFWKVQTSSEMVAYFANSRTRVSKLGQSWGWPICHQHHRRAWDLTDCWRQ